MRSRIAASAAAVLVLAAGCADPEPPRRGTTALATPTVTVLNVTGSGCPADTSAPVVAADGTSITVVYTAFTAKAGTGSAATEFRRNCRLSIQVVSPGQTFAVMSTAQHGAVDLPTGGTALQRTTYSLAGSSAGPPVDHAVTGPLSIAWDQTDPNPFLAPCGTTRNLNIDVELRVSSPGPAASLTLNGPAPGTTITLGYTPCP